MSITPRGMSVQEAYRLYREGHLLVNRKYQRKLVWSENEKIKLIDSLLKGYPIPLILLAEQPTTYGSGTYEIIDGIQRLNAIFSFIENAFPIIDGRYFDINEFARANQLAESKIITKIENTKPLLSPKDCASFLDYQLAVTIYPTYSDEEITEVFGRINSGGKQLSHQEKRQAGVITPFTELVRRLASDLRGDTSQEVLSLVDMPEISIESSRNSQGYGLKAEDTFWIKQGVLAISDLRDSEDEEMIADIAATILLNEPIARSRELLDDLYTRNSELMERVERALVQYDENKLYDEIKFTFSVLRETIEEFSNEPNCLRRIVNPANQNPIKSPFYAIYMTFFDLLVRKEQSPENPKSILEGLNKLQALLTQSGHYTTTPDRIKNINLTTGLIEKYFVKKEPSVLRHGPSLALDFENSIRRSKIETPRYEFKQGILILNGHREIDNGIMPNIIETICGIANLSPDYNGYLFIGVADKKHDADRINSLDGIVPLEICDHYVVGIDREVNLLSTTTDKYLEKIIGSIRSSSLSDPLKTQVLSHIDIVLFKGFSVIRIEVPNQQEISFVGEKAFIREGSSTVVLEGRKLLAVQQLFTKK
jgi:uncharacterized protein with ParB-like and HNH nuclease domain